MDGGFLKMLSKKIFNEQITFLALNFSLNEENLTTYKKLIYESIKDKTTDELFSSKIQFYIKTTSMENWNKKFGYKGRPAVADFIELFCVQRSMIPCEPRLEFGRWINQRLETFSEALKRESLMLECNNQKLIDND